MNSRRRIREDTTKAFARCADAVPPAATGGEAFAASLGYVEDDELIEITPQSARMRWAPLGETDRRREAREAREAAAVEAQSP
jgi:hypothetical protein